MTVRIPLTQGFEALVDAADADLVLASGRWCVSNHKSSRTNYAVRGERHPDGRHKTLRMHTLITGWDYVDHIDGDGLNNQRSNLREATHRENSRNTRRAINNSSGYVGVGWSKAAKKWRAYISPDGTQIHLGLYATAEDAARARDAAALEHFGAFARLNYAVVGDAELDRIAEAMV